MSIRHLHIAVLLSTCLLYNTVRAQDRVCAARWDSIATIIETHMAELDVEGTYIPPHDAIWVDMYAAVNDATTTYG